MLCVYWLYRKEDRIAETSKLGELGGSARRETKS